jgi:3-hydroxyisobutyrate dehydrogenase-like beta-hydroxyacid dehydrogenase
MVNQLLAGVHIASGAEAMAFGARLGINTRMLFDFITNSGGTSWYVSSSLIIFFFFSNYYFGLGWSL